MNIGFDLDKIFIDYPPFAPAALINRLYLKDCNNTLSYRIPKKPEQVIRLLTHYPLFRPPIIKNIQFVKDLVRQNKDKHYLISSRFGFLKKVTLNITKRYELNKIFDGMYFNFENNQPHIFKNGIIKKINIQRYVDDDLLLLKFLCIENPKIKFFWLNDKESKKLENNLFAIKDLSEMFT